MAVYKIESKKKLKEEISEDDTWSYWIILYADGTYQEVSGSKKEADQYAKDRKQSRGGSYRLVEWKD